MSEISSMLRSQGFDMLLQGHPDGIFVFDLQGRFLECNESLCRLTGYRHDELLQIDFAPVVAPDYLQFTIDRFYAATRGETQPFVTQGIAKDGTRFVVDITNVPLRDDAGAVVAILGIARDVGDFHHALEQLAVRSSISQVAGRVARFAGWSIDVATRELRWSDELFEILGVEPDHVPSLEESFAYYDEPYRSRISDAMYKCIFDGTPFNLELSVRNGSDEKIWANIIGDAARNDDGDVIRVDGAFQDITSLFNERQAMLDSELRVTDTITQIGVPLYFITRDWRLGFVNPAGQALVDMSADELVGRDVTEAFSPHANTLFQQVSEDAMERGIVGSTTAFLDRFQRWFEVTAYPIRDGVILTAIDVTEQMLTKTESYEALRRATFLAQMLDLAQDAMIIHDLNVGITYWNNAAEELYGWTFDEVRFRCPDELIDQDSAEREAAFEAVLSEGFWSDELEQRTRDGRTVTVDARWQLVRDDEGEPVAIFMVNTDLTERKRDSERRVRMQRMESLGTLAGGIAHDLNNVFTPIMMSLDFLTNLETDSAKRDLLASMDKSVKRGAEMIRQVLSFARGVDGVREVLDPLHILQDVRQFCAETLPKNIEVVTIATENLPKILGDPTQLMQVLINLVTNARDAMPDGGRLSLRAYGVALDGKSVQPSLRKLHGEFVVFEVIDNGLGMDAKTLGKIFEPFFTTKELGRGTGLGLSTSRAIVRSHGGAVDYESVPGFGSRFDMYLPSSPNAAVESGLVESPVGPGVIRESVRVLVVDDEEAILNMLQEVLRFDGFKVSVARNGEEALEIVSERDGNFDLVITDMNMPKMTGGTLSKRLHESWPALPIVVMSGLNIEPELQERLDAHDVLYLGKPFTIAKLNTVMTEALDHQRPEPEARAIQPLPTETG